ncbi:hypothetical protein PLICRDRAFT_480069 [Plicaturopsis crispa FD-325 SS-3]|nr:hypothetical protein PLICRDRAFT_480069 [Plicaturopsis crispa FD-325 SS-3]
MDLEPPSTTLLYTIADCSDHSGKYVAQNIMVDAPADQTSRWSGTHQVPSAKQWVLLRLENLSILKSITFGKVCMFDVQKQHTSDACVKRCNVAVL